MDIHPAIRAADRPSFEKALSLVSSGWVHVIVSDGSMGTPETLTSFSNLPSHLFFEAHVLSANPEKYTRSLIDAGFKRLIAHAECNDPRRFLDEAKYDDVDVGLALDGATELDQIEPFLENVDFVVVLTAEIDKDTFLPEAVEKIKLIRQHYPDLVIEAIGGITEATIKTVEEAGASSAVL